MSKRKTNEEFIRDVINKHGNNKYSFEKLKYISNTKDIIIHCLKCNQDIETTPKLFLRGKGCISCYSPEYLNRIPKTRESFIKECIEMYGKDNFDYSLVNYKNTNTSLDIKCNRCQVIREVTPNSFLNHKKGCLYCDGNHWNKQKFIKEGIRIHKDKYNYSLVLDLNDSSEKVEIQCIKCNNKSFFQNVHSHINHKNGCPDCGKSVQRKTQEKFLEDCYNIHSKGSFDYSETIYIQALKDIKIICGTCLIPFEQTPSEHLKMKSHKCPTCSNTIAKTQKQFIGLSENRFSKQFNYKLVKYKNMQTYIDLKCNICDDGEIIKTMPSVHLKTIAGGCEKCFRKITLEKNKNNFIKLAKKKNGNKIDYSKINYIDRRTEVDLYCNKGKHSFLQTPGSHLKSSYCPVCSGNGFDKTKSATLYYISIDSGQAYKIGITNNTVKKRFINEDFDRIKILREWQYEYGNEALEQEQKILRDFKYAQYKGDNLLFNGNTELFNQDILMLDN